MSWRNDVVSSPVWRAGDIGPVRKEIIFEPLPEIPVPVEPPSEAPEPPAEEPVPVRQ
jgi:hypothetical protein